jgi:hypothetical protein
MTKLLEKALAETVKPPNDDQDALAKAVLVELASERHWDERCSLRNWLGSSTD